VKGTADTNGVYVQITNRSTNVIVSGSGFIAVKNGKWSYTVPQSLAAGSYTVDVLGTEHTVSGILKISSNSSTSDKVSCIISTQKSSYKLGDTITLNWLSTNATYATFRADTSGKDTLSLPGDKLSAKGSQAIAASVIGNPTITLDISGTSGKGSCTTSTHIE
jgi:hypothetical protein